MKYFFKDYLGIFLILVSMPILGAIGYQQIEGWSFFDAFYMSIITLTTVGYGETLPLSYEGRIFNIVLILTGVSVATYAGSTLISNIASIDFKKRRRQKMNLRIQNLKNHTIVCGYGRMGEVICNELAENRIKFVVIEKRPELVKRLEDRKFLYIDGDAAHDDELIAAGIKNASVLVSAVDNDSDGLYISLAGRSMNKDLFIMVRANDLKAKNRMIRAGANKVILPHIMSGKKVADCVMNPAVEDFFDLTGANEKGKDKLQLVDLFVTRDSIIFDKTIKDIGALIKNLIIVGIKQKGNVFEFKPGADYRFKEGDCIIAMGTTKEYQLAKEKLRLNYSRAS